MAERRVKTIATDFLARVEGEGAMRVEIEGDRVTDVKRRTSPRASAASARSRTR
jgi:hypothetical protein